VEKKSLEELVFDNRFVAELPADKDVSNSRRQVHGACYSRVNPTPVSAPQLIAHSREVADLIGLDFESSDAEKFARVFSGTELLDGMDPMAMCYGGHQFGNWAGQLGDGRAINLGDVRAGQGGHWTLQLKGAGPTPYSRTADGLAVLRSSVREFLCSEAMFYLGVPTTRALSLVLTGEGVMRDMFYDGRPAVEKGAVVCRVAPSFIRFGNFEIFTSRGEHDTLKQIADFTIKHHFPDLELTESAESNKKVYADFFKQVCRSTAVMVAHWMRVGFVHGVMNTDNMSILGLTIDYGPYGWLEDYDPDWTPNTTDAGQGRYRFGYQTQVAKWNLSRLASALYPLIEDADPFYEGLELFSSTYEAQSQSMHAAKLGFASWNGETDKALVDDLHELLAMVETDMTIFYRELAKVPVMVEASEDQLREDQWLGPLAAAYYQPETITNAVRQKTIDWLRRYQQRCVADGSSGDQRRERMNAANPKYVLRNYLAQLAIDKADEGDFSLVQELLDVLRHPYTEQEGKDSFAEKRPEWARHRPGCSMLSCSS
jgi:uncharacterized protein YdiU (UPF0061 family)